MSRTVVGRCVGLLVAASVGGAWSGAARAAGYKEWQLGIDVGSEATYGNSVTMGYRIAKYDQIHGGLGINSTGPKIGVGNDLMVDFWPGFGLKAGAALVYSAGTTGEVEVDARFSPEGGGGDEELTAVKEYELGPSLLAGVGVGLYADYFGMLRVLGRLCYNVALTGNEVTLGDDISYDRDVEVTNEGEFEGEFDREAKKVVRAGGFGFSVGAAFIF